MQTTGFWWILIAFILYGSLHSLLASLEFKSRVERQVGNFLFNRFYRLFFNGMAAISLLPILAMAVILPDRNLYLIPFPFRVLTALIQGLAVAGLLAGVAQTGAAHFLGLEQYRHPEAAAQPRRLITSGLYRLVRHPLYSFSLLILWLMPWMTCNILAFNIGATLYLTIGTLFEERKLLLEFGEAYAAYRRCTPMLIPGSRFGPRCPGRKSGEG